MSSTQVRADEATTNHEENNYGLFSLSADTGATSGSSLLLYVMAGIAVLESKPDDQTYDKRREGKAKSSKKTVRSRRVVIDNTPRHTAGSHRGQATAMPNLYQPQPWRNAGGPIKPPAGDQATGNAIAKPNNCLLYTSPSPRDGLLSRMPSSA